MEKGLVILGRAWKLMALTLAALALAGCTADRALDIGTIDGPGSPDFSVTSARIEQTWDRTQLILQLAIANPSASIDLTSWVDLGNSYMLWCDGEPRRSPASGLGMSAWA